MTKAIVLGSVHMDLVATSTRLPGRGESVLGNGFTMAPGGKGGNQACQLALAGIQSFMLTRLGDDLFGRELLAALKAKGVDTSLVSIDSKTPTGASTVFAAEGDYSSIIVGGAAAKLANADIEAARDMLTGSDALLLQLELPIEVSLRAAEIAKASGGMVILNASPIPDVIDGRLQSLLKLTSVLVVNGIEAERLLNQKMPPLKAAQKLASQFAIATVVITQGAEGVVAFHAGTTISQKAYAAEVVDTVGAGDAFLGTFVAGMLNGLALPQILDRAIAAGAITVTRKGAYNALPNAAEVDAFLKRAH